MSLKTQLNKVLLATLTLPDDALHQAGVWQRTPI
jgi:hypothetical protein